MFIGLRLRADGRGAARCSPRQRGRAASDVDCRKRGRRSFWIAYAAQFRGSADGRRSGALRAPNGRGPRAGAKGGIAPSRHRPRSYARRNAAVVIGDKSILTPWPRAGARAGSAVVVYGRLQILDLEARLAYPASSRGGVAQLVRAPACHAGGRGFKSRLSRHLLSDFDSMRRHSRAAGPLKRASA